MTAAKMLNHPICLRDIDAPCCIVVKQLYIFVVYHLAHLPFYHIRCIGATLSKEHHYDRISPVLDRRGEGQNPAGGQDFAREDCSFLIGDKIEVLGDAVKVSVTYLKVSVTYLLDLLGFSLPIRRTKSPKA